MWDEINILVERTDALNKEILHLAIEKAPDGCFEIDGLLIDCVNQTITRKRRQGSD